MDLWTAEEQRTYKGCSSNNISKYYAHFLLGPSSAYSTRGEFRGLTLRSRLMSQSRDTLVLRIMRRYGGINPQLVSLYVQVPSPALTHIFTHYKNFNLISRQFYLRTVPKLWRWINPNRVLLFLPRAKDPDCVNISETSLPLLSDKQALSVLKLWRQTAKR